MKRTCRDSPWAQEQRAEADPIKDLPDSGEGLTRAGSTKRILRNYGSDDSNEELQASGEEASKIDSAGRQNRQSQPPHQPCVTAHLPYSRHPGARTEDEEQGAKSGLDNSLMELLNNAPRTPDTAMEEACGDCPNPAV